MGIISEIRRVENDHTNKNLLKYEHSGVDTTPLSTDVPHSTFNTVTLLLCLGAVALIVLTVLVAACLIHAKRRRRKKKLVGARYDNIFATPTRPSYSVVTTMRQHSDPSHTKTCRSFDDAKDTKPADYEHELSQYKENKERHNDTKFMKYHSFDEKKQTTPIKGIKRSKSMTASMPIDESEQNSTLSFTLKYSQKLRQLHVKLLSVSDLPTKLYGYDIYAVVYLFPRNIDGAHSRTVVGGKNMDLNETFMCDDMSLSEVDKCTLRLALHYKKKTRSGKDGFLGEMYMECSEIDWNCDQPLLFDCELEKNKVKNGTREKYLLDDLGSLFVCLEYRASANRMKVMVRKASDLPKSDKLIGRPVHYVTISLLRNNEAIRTQETKSQSGFYPIWNQPFLFDLNDVNEYSLDFVIMRGKLHTKDTVVGHVTIGQNGCRSGRLHWKEIISPRPNETAKWHSISPVLGSKIG